MGFGSSMPNQTKILIEFRKYEIELYNYFFGIPDVKEDIIFYFISKEYIFDFLKKFNFSEFSNDLNNILIYKANSEDPYNKIIANDLIKSINDKIDNHLVMEKINNKNLLEKFVSGNTFYMKMGKDGSFIPLTKDIWDLFSDLYGYDEILSKKGFVNEGEIFILTEEEKKIDCFFTFLEGKDRIYHYSFIMDTFEEFEKLKNHFKNKGPEFSARYLILNSQINICKTIRYQKFKTQMSNGSTNINNLDITIYFVDQFKFNENYDGKNIESFENDIDKKALFQNYEKHNTSIINLVNQRSNNNS